MRQVLPTDMRPGRRHALLTVLFYFDAEHVLVRCDCGNERTVQATSMRKGLTKSCGCLRGRPPRHGYCDTPEYRAWSAAKGRILNPLDAHYASYGGRGLTFDPAWARSFEAFLAHIGPKPSPDLSLDRIDNDNGYVPGNVRWATTAQQAANRRPPRERHVA